MLSVEGVVQLVLHNFSVGSDRRFGVAVEVPVEEHRQGRLELQGAPGSDQPGPFLLSLGLLLNLQTPDGLQISAGSVDSFAVVGPEGVPDPAQGPRLLIRLPGHAEALRTCTGARGRLGLLPLSRGLRGRLR